MSLAKGYAGGTHRLVAPEVTLARIAPYLGAFGITRCADVTGLDEVGIPTYCVVRPGSKTVQVSNGKGLRAVDARVSGLMEAIELHHAENPAVSYRRCSMSALAATGEPFAAPELLPQFDRAVHMDQDTRLDWVDGEELLGGGRAWLPASAVYHLPERSLFAWTSNGLASGNHPSEATLHALYEVLERHTLSQLVDGKRLRFERAGVLEQGSIADERVASLIAKVGRAGLRLVLLRPRTDLAVHTFMAVLCDPQSLGTGLRIDCGYGAHLNPAVALIRAITEAAQGRLTSIHGSREDLPEAAYGEGSYRRLHDFFTGLEPDLRWTDLPSHDRADLDDDLHTVLGAARAAGFRAVYRARMPGSHTGLEIAVVKVLIPGALDCFPI